MLKPEGKPLSIKALVLLSRIDEPFIVHQWSDLNGKFVFRNLRPGMYSLSTLLPKGGVRQRTLDITASFANAQGTVVTTVTLPPEILCTSKSRMGSTVSVAELSIPSTARKDFYRASKQLRKRNLEKAIFHLEKAVSRAPTYIEALNQLGTIYYQIQKYEKAEEYFRQALKQSPESFVPLVNLGATLYSLRKLREALQVNQKAVLARPNDALANSQLGLCHLMLGQYEQARTFLLQAKKIDPGHFSFPQLALAEIYLKKGAQESALYELENFLVKHPDSLLAPKVRRQLNRLYQNSPQ